MNNPVVVGCKELNLDGTKIVIAILAGSDEG